MKKETLKKMEFVINIISLICLIICLIMSIIEKASDGEILAWSLATGWCFYALVDKFPRKK